MRLDILFECSKLIQKKTEGEITREQFFQGMLELEEKYPGRGFKECAEKYLKRVETKKENVVRDGKAAASGEDEYPALWDEVETAPEDLETISGEVVDDF